MLNESVSSLVWQLPQGEKADLAVHLREAKGTGQEILTALSLLAPQYQVSKDIYCL